MTGVQTCALPISYIELVDKDFNAKGQDSGPVQKKPEQPKEEVQQVSK